MDASKIAALKGAVGSGGGFGGFGGFEGCGGFGSPAASRGGFGGFGAPAAASSAAFGFAFSSGGSAPFVGGGNDSSLRTLATVTHANHRVLVASLGLPVPYPAHIPRPPLHVHAPPGITYRHVCPQPPLSCVAQTPIPCSARAAQDKHACMRILESMTGISFVSLTHRQRLLLLCMGGRVACFLNAMFPCNESWQSKQRLKYAICLCKAHRASIPCVV
jgi:hypothetical protein